MSEADYVWSHRVWRRYWSGTLSPWFLSRQDVCRGVVRHQKEVSLPDD